MNAKDYLDREVKVFRRKWKGDIQIVTDEVLTSRGLVTEIKKNSRTMVTVKDIDRGPGWCNDTKKYIGVKTPNGWYRGQNHDFKTGIIHECHISQLELVDNE